MKNFLLLSFASILMFSCETTPKEEEKGPAPGYLLTADGTKIDARDADPLNLAIWEKYMDAHNNKDFETIASMNHDSIVLNLWDGRNLMGNDTHIEILKGYIEEFNPIKDCKKISISCHKNNGIESLKEVIEDFKL